MKKIIIYILIATILISLTGCHTAQNLPPQITSTSTTTSTTVVSTTTTEPTPTFYIAPSELKLVDKNLYTYGEVDKALADQLEQTLQSYNKNISIACWSTDGSKAILYNTKQTYFSACTIKMPLMYAYCQEIEKGNINLRTLHTYEPRHWHQGSGDIRYGAYYTQYTTKQLIQKSINISDNVAYKMLLEAYGKKPLEQLSKALNCKSLNLSPGGKWAKAINARDLAVVWSEIYNYFNTNSSTAKMLKDSCTNTKFNYGTKTITEYDYSHKSGDNFGEYRAYHDAGIVWSDVPYIYVVFTRSEGTTYDSNVVDTSMELVKEIMT